MILINLWEPRAIATSCWKCVRAMCPFLGPLRYKGVVWCPTALLGCKRFLFAEPAASQFLCPMGCMHLLCPPVSFAFWGYTEQKAPAVTH
jgi:hypothetical protein